MTFRSAPVSGIAWTDQSPTCPSRVWPPPSIKVRWYTLNALNTHLTKRWRCLESVSVTVRKLLPSITSNVQCSIMWQTISYSSFGFSAKAQRTLTVPMNEYIYSASVECDSEDLDSLLRLTGRSNCLRVSQSEHSRLAPKDKTVFLGEVCRDDVLRGPCIS